MRASVITIAEAVADLATTPGRIWRFHREGRLTVIYLAGTTTGSRRGSKDGRIDRAEWERFKATLSVSVLPPLEPAPTIGAGRPRKGMSPPELGSLLERFERKAKTTGS